MNRYMKIIAIYFLLSLPWIGAASAQSAQTLIAGTTNSSATIITGNSFQKVLPAVTISNQRKSLTIQNNNVSDNCWIAFGTLANGTVITAGNATKAESIQLTPGQAYTRYYPYVPSDELEATCATSSDPLYIDNQ